MQYNLSVEYFGLQPLYLLQAVAKQYKVDNLVNFVKNMSISGGLDASGLSNKDDENKLANAVGEKCGTVGQKQITI